jgi:hypothetical protein
VTAPEGTAIAALVLGCLALYVLSHLVRQLAAIQIEIKTLRQEMREMLHEGLPNDPRGSYGPYLAGIARKLNSVLCTLDLTAPRGDYR